MDKKPPAKRHGIGRSSAGVGRGPAPSNREPPISKAAENKPQVAAYAHGESDNTPGSRIAPGSDSSRTLAATPRSSNSSTPRGNSSLSTQRASGSPKVSTQRSGSMAQGLRSSQTPDETSAKRSGGGASKQTFSRTTSDTSTQRSSDIVRSRGSSGVPRSCGSREPIEKSDASRSGGSRKSTIKESQPRWISSTNANIPSISRLYGDYSKKGTLIKSGSTKRTEPRGEGNVAKSNSPVTVKNMDTTTRRKSSSAVSSTNTTPVEARRSLLLSDTKTKVSPTPRSDSASRKRSTSTSVGKKGTMTLSNLKPIQLSNTMSISIEISSVPHCSEVSLEPSDAVLSSSSVPKQGIEAVPTGDLAPEIKIDAVPIIDLTPEIKIDTVPIIDLVPKEKIDVVPTSDLVPEEKIDVVPTSDLVPEEKIDVPIIDLASEEKIDAVPIDLAHEEKVDAVPTSDLTPEEKIYAMPIIDLAPEIKIDAVPISDLSQEEKIDEEPHSNPIPYKRLDVIPVPRRSSLPEGRIDAVPHRANLSGKGNVPVSHSSTLSDICDIESTFSTPPKPSSLSSVDTESRGDPSSSESPGLSSSSALFDIAPRRGGNQTVVHRDFLKMTAPPNKRTDIPSFNSKLLNTNAESMGECSSLSSSRGAKPKRSSPDAQSVLVDRSMSSGTPPGSDEYLPKVIGIQRSPNSEEPNKVIGIVGSMETGRNTLATRLTGVLYREKTFRRNGFHLSVVVVPTDNTDPTNSDDLESSYMHSLDAIILLFSLENSSTLEELRDSCVPMVRKKRPELPPMLLVGNKLDIVRDIMSETLSEDRKAMFVNRATAEDMMEHFGAEQYVECSALTMENVENVELKLVDLLPDVYPKLNFTKCLTPLQGVLRGPRKIAIIGNRGTGRNMLAARLCNLTDIRNHPRNVPWLNVLHYESGRYQFALQVSVIPISPCETDVSVVEWWMQDNLKNLDAVIVLYSIDDPNSLVNAVKRWEPTVSPYMRDRSHVYIVGNKIDLRQDANRIDLIHGDEIETMMCDDEVQYFECSALTMDNIQQIQETFINEFVTGWC